MSKHFEEFVMDVLPWKTIAFCLIMIAIAECLQVGIMLTK